MTVSRILNIDIKNRGLFTSVYGHTDDIFVGNDLKRYDLNQQLYLYLKAEGYDIVVFYDINNLFHSYKEQDLILFQEFKKKDSNILTKGRYRASHLKSPLKGSLRQKVLQNEINEDSATSNTDSAIYERFYKIEDGEDTFYKLKAEIQILPRLKTLFKDKEIKTALIIKVPSVVGFSNENQVINFFSTMHQQYAKKELNHKIIVSYDTQTPEGLIAQIDGTFFQKRFVKVEGDIRLPSENCFFIEEPEENEITNLLHRQRLLCKFEFQIDSTKKIASNLYRGEKGVSWTIKDIIKFDQKQIDKYQGIGVKSAEEQLKELIGMLKVKEEVNKHIKVAKYRMKNGIDDKKVFSKHLILTGNPGTGKTEVARLISQIYKEEGVLRKGHLVEVKSEDLVAGYVGQTALKTKSKCQEARGGVLFIDEAYRLSQKENNDFGQEAIDTILTEMENHRDDLVVIAAGYEDKMKGFISSNEGLKSRFRKIINLDNYTSDELFQIFKLKSKGLTFESEVLEIIKQNFQDIVLSGDTSFGNGRYVRDMISEIELTHIERLSENDLESDLVRIEDIPDEFLPNSNKNKTNYELEEAIKELDSMIGLNNVKKTIRAYANRIKAQQKRNKISESKRNLEFSLNFVFTGNPGTGKTTVARLLGKILKGLGLLQKDSIFEVNRDGIVGQYIGETAIKTRKKIDEAKGGVFFLDEAYSLTNRGENDFGKESIETILAAMTDPRYQGKMAFVVAGYPEDMVTFIESNPGLQRRFNNYVHFENYSSRELVEIFNAKVADRDFKLGEGVNDKAFRFFEVIPRNRFFGNAGEAEKLVDIAITNLDTRIVEQDIEDATEIVTILECDIPTVEKRESNPSKEKPQSEIAPQTSNEDTETIADKVLPNYNSDNKDEVFIRSVCDDVESLAFYTVKAFFGESEPELVIEYFEDKEFQFRIKQVNEFKSKYDLSFFEEIYEGCGGFINFFKGVQNIILDDIPQAISLWDSAISIAEKYDIEILQKTASVLKRYWISITKLKTNPSNIESIITDLEAVKKDLRELDNQDLEQMIDVVQAEIFFISGVNALQNLDNNKGRYLIDLASASMELNADKYFSKEPNDYNLFKGLAKFYKTIYYFNTGFMKLNNLDFKINGETDNIKKFNEETINLFEKLSISDARTKNILALCYALNSLNIVMEGLGSILHSRFHQQVAFFELESLHSKLKEAKEKINEMSEPADVVIWLEICDILDKRINNLENFSVPTENSKDIKLPFSNSKNILTEEKINQQPLDLSKENVKKTCIEYVGTSKLFDALFILEDYFKSLDDNERLIQVVILRGSLTKADHNWKQRMQEDSANDVQNNRIAYGILDIATHL